MKKERIFSEIVDEPPPKLWSNCMRVNNVVYISGLTARQADNVTIAGEDEYAQARIIFSKIEAYMKASGGVMDDIVQMVIYVTNIVNNKKVWKAREEFFSGDFPTCALVEVSNLASPEILVEISASAHIGCS